MSVYGELLKAVKATLQAVTGLSGHTIKVRKRIAFFKKNDVVPIIVIAPEVDRVAAYAMPNTIHMDYPITVAVIDENDLLLEDVDTVLELRQTIRRTLMVTTFDAVSEVFDVVAYDPSPPFPPGAIDQAFDVSLQRFTYRAAEVRTE